MKLNYEQVNWLVSLPEYEQKELVAEMVKENLVLVWNDDVKSFVTKKAQSVEERIQSLMEEIEGYKQTIDDAEGALCDAEHELNELLAEQYENMESDYPIEIDEDGFMFFK